MNKVLIVGANFANKGAQALLMTITEEIKSRYPQCEVLFGCNGERYNEKSYTFKKLYYTKKSQEYMLANTQSSSARVKEFFKNVIKFIVLKSEDLFYVYDAKKVIQEIDLIIDVSGYALGDTFSEYGRDYYLNHIKVAKKYNIPIIMMPQSFGPFEQIKNRDSLTREICELLQYPLVIYSREEQSTKYLLELVNDTTRVNVKQSPDIVLLHEGVGYSHVCTENYTKKALTIKTHKNIAIVPNLRCFTDSVQERNYRLYDSILSRCLEEGFDLYIIQHSHFDDEVCERIFRLQNSPHIHLLKELDCIDYESIIGCFDFVICSRYHGSVHAYRQFVPNIILGWANKYIELANALGQGDYVVNIRGESLDESIVLQKIDYMIQNHVLESEKIKQNLSMLRNRNNCLTVFSEMEW